MMLAPVYGALSTRSAPDPNLSVTDSPAAFEPVVVFVAPSWWTHRVNVTMSRSWFDEAVHRIKDAFRLNDDWDHEGAQAVTLEAASSAVEFARWLDSLGLPRPIVSPTQDGGIGFEWLGGTQELFLEVLEHTLEATVRDVESGEYWEGTPDELGDKFFEALRSLAL